MHLPEELPQQPQWPLAAYCIYRIAHLCPSGFHQGSITLKGSSAFDIIGNTPLSVEDNTATLHFCCRNESNHDPLQFSAGSPFTLFQKSGKCPDVEYMQLQSEWLQINYKGDVSKEGSTPFVDLTVDTLSLNFCVYQPIQTCYHKKDKGGSYRGTINFTSSQKECLPWADVPNFSPSSYVHYQYVLADNHCSSIRDLHDIPYCLSDNYSDECGVPPCEFDPDQFRVLSPGYPTSSSHGDQDATYLAIDGLIDTCIRYDRVHRPWWQIDLQQDETVIAVEIQVAKQDCALRLASISLSSNSDGFLGRNAQYCLLNISSASFLTFLKCHQPVTGRFLTIQQLEHWQHDSSMDMTQSYCLEICELSIYVQTDDDQCGKQLISNKVLPESQIFMSSNTDSPYSAILYGDPGWCADHNDQSPYILVDMLLETKVNGFISQGSIIGRATEITVLHGSSKARLSKINYLDRAMVFKSQRSVVPENHRFPRAILARFLQFNIKAYDGQPCLRVDIVGCSAHQDNIAKDSIITTSSSTNNYGKETSVLLDRMIETCFGTEVEPEPWILLELSSTYHIQSITMKVNPLDDLHQMCYNPAVRGFNYFGHVNTTIGGRVCQPWNSLKPHGHVQDGSMFPEGTLSAAENFCRNPDGEMSVWCYTMDPDMRWEFCDVEPCSSYMEKIDVSGSQKYDGPFELCTSVTNRGDSPYVAAWCDASLLAKFVRISAKDSFLLLCEIVISGSTLDGPTIKANGDQIRIECPNGSYLNIDDLSSHGLNTTTNQREIVKDYCLGNKAECILPNEMPRMLLTELEDDLDVGLVCTLKDESQCGGMLHDMSTVITTSDYLALLDSRDSCLWTLEVAEGSFVMINVSALNLVSKEENFWQDCQYNNPGECRDSLQFKYNDNELIEATKPIIWIAPVRRVTVELSTCYWRRPKHLPSIETHVEFEATECPGCFASSECSGLKECNTECGNILSPSFPSNYGSGLSCIWIITVSESSYVQLKFNSFDVYEMDSPVCTRDRLEVSSINPHEGTATTLLGAYCNTNPPKGPIESLWNMLRVTFITDTTISAQGFWLSYRGIQYQVDIQVNESLTNCLPGWDSYNGNCYSLIQTDALTWMEAELHCRKQGAHLASILSQIEMNFIHDLLVRNQVFNTGTYIGLTDADEEGIWRWVDSGQQAIYSYWEVEADTYSEPDGSFNENCAVILLSSLRGHRSWRDVPCAIDQVRHFLCKISPENPEPETLSPVQLNTAMNTSCPNLTFTCESGECISEKNVCDQVIDCKDASDEAGCTCGEGFFTCDQNCLPISRICDFRVDCEDEVDERDCLHPQCNLSEYQCSNGQCIPEKQRCNLIVNCMDSSDENACDTCENAFQCYDGSCIPLMSVCDGYADCPGSFARDEENCQAAGFKSCLDFRHKGFVKNGNYYIELQGFAENTIEVECDFTTYTDKVVTIIHHDSEQELLNNGFEHDASYERNITYFIPVPAIRQIKENATSCEQYFWLQCPYSEAMYAAYWYSVDGEAISYEYDELQGDPPCKCRLREGSCDVQGFEERFSCVCNYNNYYLAEDYGFFRDTELLPVMGITLSDTGDEIEYAKHIIGPLRCLHEVSVDRVRRQCANFVSYPEEKTCLLDKDNFGRLDTCRDGSHLLDCEDAECPDNYAKCPHSYCVSQKLICDGNTDCPNGEDELLCGDTFSCAGMFHCKSANFCLPLDNWCDGIRHCPHGDDEDSCSQTCPDECSCIAEVVVCRGSALNDVPSIQSNARLLNLENNIISNLTNTSFVALHNLVELNLAHNSIQELREGYFVDLGNLLTLNISFNDIEVIGSASFAGLRRLRELDLTNNMISEIEADAFVDLVSILELDLSNMAIEEISSSLFSPMSSLTKLDLSTNRLRFLQSEFAGGLSHLKVLYLYGNEMQEYDASDFASFNLLDMLHTDEYLFCCLARLNEENCLPLPDKLSSCKDLMREGVLRAFLWIFGIMALLGNLFSIGYHMKMVEKKTVTSELTKYLACADCLFGVYMICIASVDQHYRGVYIEYAKAWKHSAACAFLGTLATFSSEASVLVLFVITCDRLLRITRPFSKKNLTLRSVHKVMLIVWSLVIAIAVVPLIPSDYFKGRFYSRSSVCMSIHITRESPPGWQYSVAVCHGLNLVAFLFIFLAYGYMYTRIKSSSKAAGNKGSHEMTIARKMTLIVLTDFCCWFPINTMGLLALGGMDIPGEMYSWTIVFILPINSAINPILYTISNLSFKTKKAQLGNCTSDRSDRITSGTTLRLGINMSNSEDCSDEKITSIKDVKELLHIIWQLSNIVDRVHKTDHVFSNISLNGIAVRDMVGGPAVFILTPLLPMDDESEKYEDIQQLGKTLSALIKMHTMAAISKNSHL